MDTLTHALSGALLGRATAQQGLSPASLRRRVAAGFLAAAAPDLDFVVSFVGTLEYLLNHRGVTHSVLVLPFWAFVLAWLLSKLLRSPEGWRPLYGTCAMALGAHIAGDLITSFGTMVFAPVSDWRAGIGTTFIIDLWFSGIIIAGLVASLFWRNTRVPARLAGAVLVGYVCFQAVQKERALDFARDYAALQGLKDMSFSAQPRAVSPFNWTVFVSDADTHRLAHVNLVRTMPREAQPDDGFIARLDRAYQPLAMARWESAPRYGADPALQPAARAAWSSDALAFFRWFAELPVLAAGSGGDCMWFTDLRFVMPGRAGNPFFYGACRAERDGGDWRAFRRNPDGAAQALQSP
jgi:inner membrane protein